MSIEMAIYLISVINSFQYILIIIFFILLSLSILSAVVGCNEKDDKEKKYVLKGAKNLFVMALLTLLPIIFIPNKNEMYAMLTAHYLKQTQIPVKVESLLNKKLDDLINEIKK